MSWVKHPNGKIAVWVTDVPKTAVVGNTADSSSQSVTHGSDNRKSSSVKKKEKKV